MQRQRRRQSGTNDAFVYTSLGDGTTSEGEVEEAIRDAVRNMAPLLFVVEDDRLGHLDARRA